MFKKALPLSALVATVMGVTTVPTYIPGAWKASATLPSSASTACCYITAGAVANIANADTTNFIGLAAVPAATGCTGTGAPGTIGTNPAAGTWTVPLKLTASSAVEALALVSTTGTPAATTGGATFTVSADGSSMTYTPFSVGGGTCNPQTFTRNSQAAITPSPDGKWTVGEGSGTDKANCCFLDTATTLGIATSTTNTVATGKYANADICTTVGAPASKAGTYNKDLVAGASTGQATDYLSTGNDLFTYDSTAKTITFVPQGKTAAACTQTLTYVSSSATIIAAMTPVVVGAATVMGMIIA